MIPYNELEKHFIAPSIISPFYSDEKIPRKLKKKIKKYLGVHWKNLTNGERRWHYLEKQNSNYKRFLIKEITKK